MTQIDRTTLKSNTTTLFADNTTGDISASDMRTQMNNIADSVTFRSTGYVQAPTANDDGVDTAGNGTFGIGDIWVNESTNKAYVCVDASTGTAIWVDMTYIDAGALSATLAPAVTELAVWVNGTTLRGYSGLTWDNTTFSITGNIAVTGNVDGRNVSADGAKLDGIPVSAIDALIVGNENVGGTTAGYTATTLTVRTGDGLQVTNPTAGEAQLEIRNNDVSNDAVDRTLTASDNFSYITNEGAAATVTWTVPLSTSLESSPRLVATFMKVANQTMQIKGVSSVTINGIPEAGGNESLIEICPTPYDTFAVLFFSGTQNTYYVYQGTDIKKLNTVANTELAFWTGDGTIDGIPDILWDGTALNVTGGIDASGEVLSNWTFNPQVGLTYTAALTDRGRMVTMNNAAANVLTIPPNATTAFPIGTEIRVLQIGAGATSITAGAGVTLNSIVTGSGALTGQWDEVRLYKAATDTWYATGSIGAVA